MNKLFVATAFVLCLVPAFAYPAKRTVDNSLDSSFRGLTNDNMPQDVQQTFPELLAVTKKLTKLYASGNPMTITADIFADATQLEFIDLSNGDVREIESRAFYGPKKLKTLNLSGNKLAYLPGDMFPARSGLKEMNLAHNQITRLNRATFKSLQHLKKLNLSNNQLTQLDGSVFADMIHLEELDLTGNPIQSISEEFFASLPHGLALSFDDQYLDVKSLDLTEQWAL
jgi:Leucine-rich repeat (LRR) protein